MFYKHLLLIIFEVCRILKFLHRTTYAKLKHLLLSIYIIVTRCLYTFRCSMLNDQSDPFTCLLSSPRRRLPGTTAAPSPPASLWTLASPPSVNAPSRPCCVGKPSRMSCRKVGRKLTRMLEWNCHLSTDLRRCSVTSRKTTLHYVG